MSDNTVVENNRGNLGIMVTQCVVLYVSNRSTLNVLCFMFLI